MEEHSQPDGYFKNILDHLLEGCQIIDFDWRYRYVNAMAAQHGRQTVGELLGRRMMDAYPGIDETPLFKVLTHCMAARSSARFTNEFTYADSSKAWFDLSIETVPEGLLIMSLDISQSKQAELDLRRQVEKMAAVYETTHDLVMERDLSQLLRIIVERAAQLVKAEAGGLYLCEPDKKQVCCVVSYHTPQNFTGTVLNYGEGAAGRVAQTGEPLIIDDYRIWAGRAPTFEEEQPFSAVLSVPMKWQDEIMGVIHVLGYDPQRHFTPDDLQLVTAFANQAAIAVQNARLVTQLQEELVQRRQAEEALQRSEQVLELFVEHAPAAIAMFDRHMVYLAASRRYLVDYRLGDQPLKGRSHYEIFPEIPERWKEIHRRCLAGTIEKCEEDPFPREDGTLDWVRWEILPWYERSGKIGGILLFSEVITERKQAQDQLRESQANLLALIENTDGRIWSVDNGYRLIVGNSIFRNGLSALLGREFADGEMVLQERLPADDRAEWQSFYDRALRGERFNVERTARYSDKPRWSEYRFNPIRAADGQVVGVMVSERDSTEHKQDEVLQAALYQISEAANNAANLDDLFSAVHAIVGQVMPARNFYIALYDAGNNLINFPYFVDEMDGSTPALPALLGRSLTEHVLHTGRPLLCDNVLFEEMVQRGEIELVGAPSPIWLGAPLIVEGQTIGLMALQDYVDPQAYGERELQILEYVSGQVAKAIERTRLRNDLERRNRILSALQEATLVLMRQLELNEVLQIILTQAAQLMDTPHGFLYLVASDEAELVARVGSGVFEQYLGKRLQPGEGLAGKIWQTGQLLAVENYRHWLGRSIQYDDTPFGAVIGAPLTSGTHVSGVLGLAQLDPNRKFGDKGLDLLSRFAQLASLALENARLYTLSQQELAERSKAEAALLESRSQLAGIIQSAMDGIITVDEDQRIVLFNAASEKLFGCAAVEAIGQPLDRFIPDRLHAAHREHIRRFEQTGLTSRTMMNPLRGIIGLRTNGEEFPIEASISQIEVNGQKLYTVIHRDVTEQRRAEAALRQSEDKFSKAFHISPDFIIITRLVDGLYLDINEGFTAITGYTSEDVLGKTSLELSIWVDPADRARLVHGLQEHGEVLNLEAPFRTKDGRIVTGLMSARVIEINGEKCILSITRNITERKQAEEAIRRYVARLEILQAIDRDILAAQSFAEMARAALHRLGPLTACRHTGVVLFDFEKRESQLVASYEQGGEPLMTEANPPVWSLSALERLKQASVYVVSDLAALEQRSPNAERLLAAGIHSYISAPLMLEGNFVGMLNLSATNPAAFTSEHEEIAREVANQLAISFQQARLREALQRYAEELEQRVAERTAELDAERRRVQTILDTAGEGILVTDLDWTIRYVNPALERITGYQAVELIGQLPRVWHSEQTPDTMRAEMNAAVARGESWQGETINRRKDGRLYDASLTITPLRDAPDQPTRIVIIHRDISRLKELDRLKSKFVSDVSHELRTPVTNLNLYLNLLERGKPEKRADYLTILHQQAARLAQLIEDILDLSRGEVSAAPAAFEQLDLNLLAAQVVVTQQPSAELKGLTLHFEPQGDLPLVAGIATQLTRVLTNLVANAINYTQNGQVTVATSAERDWVLLKIRDTGQGIGPEDLPHLFERFYRGRQAIRAKLPGTGLGLAIVKEIVETHGGRITVESQVGVGSTFTLSLPIGYTAELTKNRP